MAYSSDLTNALSGMILLKDGSIDGAHNLMTLNSVCTHAIQALTSCHASICSEERRDSIHSQQTNYSYGISSIEPSPMPSSSVSSMSKKRKIVIQRERRKMKQAGTYIRKRPSMKDYDYGSEEDDFIVNCYRDFAAKNNDRWIPCRALLKTQNERFPNMKRNVSGLQSHTDRKQSLRTVRGFYK